MLPPKEFKHIVEKAIQKFIVVKWPIEIRSSIRVGLLKFTLGTGLPKARGNLDLVFPRDGTSRDKLGRDVPLSRDKKILVPVSRCPGTRAGANFPGQNELKSFKKIIRFPVFDIIFLI